MAQKKSASKQINKQESTAYLFIGVGQLALGVVLSAGALGVSEFARGLGLALLIAGAISIGISISYTLKKKK